MFFFYHQVSHPSTQSRAQHLSSIAFLVYIPQMDCGAKDPVIISHQHYMRHTNELCWQHNFWINKDKVKYRYKETQHSDIMEIQTQISAADQLSW